jgi:hypothetical protein
MSDASSDQFQQTVRLRHLSLEIDRIGRKKHPHIYAISDGEAVKFGFTWNLSARMRGLQNATPRKLLLLADVFADAMTERAIHWHLSECRIHGEWFRLCDESRHVIDLMIPSKLRDLYKILGID